MITIPFAGGMLLLIGIGISKFLSSAPMVFAIYFAIVATLMLLEYIRRVKVLKLFPVLSIPWILYPLILLFVILYA